MSSDAGGGDSKVDKEGAKAINKALCNGCGHKWHWTEVFFIVMFVVGVGITIAIFLAGSAFPAVIVVILGALTSLTAFAHVWNLCTARRLSLAADSLMQTVEILNRENERALATCERIKNNNDVFKMDLQTLDGSRKLIGKSVVSLDAANKKQEAFVEETRQIVERREKFGEELKALLSSENKNAAKQAKMNLKEMIINVVYANDKHADSDNESNNGDHSDDGGGNHNERDKMLSSLSGVPLRRQESTWSDQHSTSMKSVLARENIAWSHEIADVVASAPSQYELFSALDTFLDLHFDALDQDYMRLKELEEEALQLELDIGRATKDNLEATVAAQERDLINMQRRPVTEFDEEGTLV